ncbi:MAG: hypothetical protein AB7N76_27675 [Planctomycetota bacterium]
MASKEELKRALKAFKKRLKLQRQDDESSIGKSPLSSGRASNLVGIRPPEGFPEEIWDELVAAGKLRRVPGRRDQFELVSQPS